MSPPPLRILVVDDEEAIVELVSEYLRTRGFDVASAGDGDAALATLQSRPFDVILVDLRLPSRGGMALLEAMVDLPWPVAVVVMTGYGTVETATQAMKLGASDYLLKPVRLREVNDALQLAVESTRERRRDQGRRHRCRLYEALLDLGARLTPDELLQELAAVLQLHLGAGAVHLDLDRGTGWAPCAERKGWPGFGEESQDLEMGDGPRLRVRWAGPPADEEALAQARDLVGAVLSALPRAARRAPADG